MKRTLFVACITIVVFLLLSFCFSKGTSFSGLATDERILTYTQLEPEYAKVAPGDSLVLGVTMVKLGATDRKDVVVGLFIKDAQGASKLLSSQTVALETKTSLILAVDVPDALKSNAYTLFLEVRDLKTNDLLATASQRILVFHNFSIKFDGKNDVLLIVLTLVVLLLVLDLVHRYYLARSLVKKRQH